MQPKNVNRLLASDDTCPITQPQSNRILSTQGKCRLTDPEIVSVFGRSAATFLQQLHYWITRPKHIGMVFEDKKWIYNTYEDWAKDIKIYSVATIRLNVKALEEAGVIISRNLNKKKCDKTKWYTIDYDALAKQVSNLAAKEKFVGTFSSLTKEAEHALKSVSKNQIKISSPSVSNYEIINRITENTSEKINNKSEQTTQLHFVKFDSDKSKQVEEGCKNNLILDLLEMWNQTVEEGRDPILLNKKRAQYLAAAYKQKFESSLENWKIFCEKIASSQFLMGKIKETFRATIDWILKFEVIQRIFEGDFGISKSYTAKACPPDKSKVEISIESGNELPEIKNIHKTLLNRFGASTYKAWFSIASINFKEDDSIIFIMPSRFTAQHVDTHFGLDLRKIWANLEVKWG